MKRKYRSKIKQRTFQNFMTEAKLLRDKRILTDFTLECEGDVFPVHRMVLAASSPYFRDYFIQQKNLQQTTIKIDFIKSKVLQIILDYFYTGRIIIKEQSQELVKNLLEASSEFQVPLLYDYCLELLLNKQSKDISLLDWTIIEELNSKIISKAFLNNILKKLPLFPECEAFLQCNFNLINSLLFGPQATDCDQSIVLQCILTWIKHDSIGRKEYLTTFLEKVEFERINTIQLLNFKHENLLLENSFFQRICTSYLFKQGEIGKNEKVKNSNIKQEITEYQREKNRKCKSSEISSETSVNNVLDKCEFTDIEKSGYKFFICCDYIFRWGTIIYTYDFSNDKLEKMIAHPLYCFQRYNLVKYKNSIYYFPSSEIFDNCFVYNIQTNQLSEHDLKGNFKKISFRSGVAAVELHDSVYDVGGNFGLQMKANNVVRIDPESFTFENVASLPAVNKNGNIPIVAVNHCLFAWLHIKLYKYIPEDDKWFLVETELNNKIETEDVLMVTGNGKIFIIEKSQPKNVWIYDPIENSLSKDFVPSELKECDEILNLEKQQLEFLVRMDKKYFIYRPYLNCWSGFNPKRLVEFNNSRIMVLPS